MKDGLVAEDGVTVVDEAEDIAPSTTAIAAHSTSRPVQYVIICNLPGHYEQGMNVGLKVT